MKQWFWWAGAGAMSLAATVAAETIELTSYYPSPRGVYNEVRANRYAGLSDDRFWFDAATGAAQLSSMRAARYLGPEGERYWFDAEKGTVRVSSVVLEDGVTGRRYELIIRDRRVLLRDMTSQQAFLVLQLDLADAP